MKTFKIKYSFLLLLSALLMSCTDFFSTSLALWAARDPNKLVPEVNVGNVDDLISLAENDSDLSLAVLKKILDALDDASDEDKQKLQSAAVEAAVNASGLGQAVLNSLDKLDAVDTADDAKELFISALDAMENLEETSSVLVDIINSGNFDTFLSTTDANDLALAAALLIASEAKQSDDPDSYLSAFGSDGAREDNEAEKIAVEIIKELNTRLDELSGVLASILEGLGFDLGDSSNSEDE